jgi:hypothetical protein
MPAEVPRTIAKIGSAAIRMVMKTRRPINPLQTRSPSGREVTALEGPFESESGCGRRALRAIAVTVLRPNYRFASAYPKIETAPLQAGAGRAQPAFFSGFNL